MVFCYATSYWLRRYAFALLALVWAAPAAEAQTFGSPTAYSMGKESYPYNVAVGDVNSDGIQDLVATNSISYGTGLLAVKLGLAGGGYGPFAYYPTGYRNYPTGVALGDVTGDGVVDAVVGISTGAAVFAGLGNGTFAPVTVYASGLNFRCGSVLLNDLNKDGKLDMVLVTNDYDQVVVFLRQATDFSTPTYFQAANGLGDTWDLTLGDMTGDGKADLVVANFTDNTVSVLPGKGDGTFAQHIAYPAGISAGKKDDPVNVTVADLNRDGRLDVVTANYGTNTVGVLLGKAGGTLGTMTTYPSGGTTPICARVGDLNGDGRLDVAITNEVGGTGVLLGKGDGTLGSVVMFPTPYYSQEVVLRDLNKDGRLDMVTADYGPGTLTVLLNTGTYVPLAVTPALTAAQVSLYPNPAHERFTLELPTLARVSSVRAELLNSLGQIVREQDVLAGKGLSFDTADLAAGVYTLRLQAGETMLTKRVVVN